MLVCNRHCWQSNPSPVIPTLTPPAPVVTDTAIPTHPTALPAYGDCFARQAYSLCRR